MKAENGYTSPDQNWWLGELREQAHAEKTQLLDKFSDWMRWDEIYQDTCKMRVKLSGYSKEAELGSCERCKKLTILFYGRIK